MDSNISAGLWTFPLKHVSLKLTIWNERLCSSKLKEDGNPWRSGSLPTGHIKFEKSCSVNLFFKLIVHI